MPRRSALTPEVPPCPPASARTLIRLLVLALLVAPIGSSLAPSGLRAQACGEEREPNDAEADVQPLAGLFCVAGRLPAGDQDLFLWEIDEETATRPVALRLTGVPGTVTTAALVAISSEPGVEPVVAGARLLEVTAGPTDAAPVGVEALVPAGSYVLGVSRSTTLDGSDPATDAYTVEASAGAALPADAEREPNDDPTTAMAVSGAFAVAGDLEGSIDTFVWAVSEEDAARGWEIRVVGPVGLSAELTLLSADGATLALTRADALGQMALYDLALDPGDYLLQMTGPTDVPHPYGLSAVAVDRPASDLEPNDTAAAASDADLVGGVVTGRLTPGDTDVYRLPVEDRLTGSLFDVKLIRRSAQPLSLCLLAADGTTLQCKEGEGAVSLTDVSIPAGDYSLAVKGEDNLDVPYLLRVDATSAPVADFEAEPNDAVLVASPFEPSVTMRGSFTGAEDDVFRVPITGDPQLWLVQVEGVGLERLTLQDAAGRDLAVTDVPAGTPSATLNDLYLTAGDHWVRVRGTDGDYAVTLVPLGPPDPNGERETNNSAIFGEPLLVGQARTGRIVQTADVDYYRFSLAALDHVVVRLTAPPDAVLLARVTAGQDELARWDAAEAGEGFAYDGLLAPGDYAVIIGATGSSTGRYELSVERSDPFVLADDQEPNGTTATARPLPATGRVRGDVDLQNDTDWYALPEGDPADLEVFLEGANVRLGLTDGLTEYAVETDETGERWTVIETPPADAPLYVVVSGTGGYRLSLGDDGGSIFDVPGASDLPAKLPVTATLTVPVAEVAAYLTVGQRVTGELTLTNDGAEAMTLALRTASSHYAWALETAEGTVELAAGQTATMPITVTIQDLSLIHI